MEIVWKDDDDGSDKPPQSLLWIRDTLVGTPLFHGLLDSQKKELTVVGGTTIVICNRAANLDAIQGMMRIFKRKDNGSSLSIGALDLLVLQFPRASWKSDPACERLDDSHRVVNKISIKQDAKESMCGCYQTHCPFHLASTEIMPVPPT